MIAEELLEGLRPVVERARQAEAVVDQRLLARAVALVHAADLRDGLVGLVDEADEVVGEVVEQAVGALARLAAVEDARVVLDPEQKPSSRSISMSYWVRWRSRCASSSLPSRLELGAARLELARRSAATARSIMALAHVVVRRRPDRDVLEVVGDHLARSAGRSADSVLDLVAEQHDRGSAVSA